MARVDGEPAGFLAALLTDGDQTAVIDLIAVDDGYQRRGLGRALNEAFIARYHQRCPRLRVGTQVANIPALGLYQQLGFRVAASQYVLHRHL